MNVNSVELVVFKSRCHLLMMNIAREGKVFVCARVKEEMNHMIKDLVTKIGNLKADCNEASRLHGKSPIFHSASEIERLAVKLPLFVCQTQDDFQKFLDMIYKFIIESSGNGKRLPEDPRIDSMKFHIKELRNHYHHIREYGRPGEVRKKYKKVRKIYQTLIDKEVPEEEDWKKLQIVLLREIATSLQRVHKLLVAEKPPEIDKEFEIFEDNRIFIFGRNPVKSRTAMKRGFLATLAEIPVFMPEFTIVPPPQLGRTKSAVYLTSAPPCRGKIVEFGKFAREIERKWLETFYLREVYGPFHWTISEYNNFTYGCGAENLIDELRNHDRATVGAILQGCFGEHYDRTCFLILYAYRKGGIILDIGINLYLSCIPASWDWFEELYNAHQHFSSVGLNVEIDHFSIEPLPVLLWRVRGRRRTKLEILGGIRREWSRIRDESHEDITGGNFAGIIINNSSLRRLNYHIDKEESWNIDRFPNLECPLHILDESIMSITNPVPSCNEVESGSIVDINAPTVSMFRFEAHGTTIYGIAIHSSFPKIETHSVRKKRNRSSAKKD